MVASRNEKNTLANAPGKMFLFGEHSVLYGHPAIVVPIKRYVSVESFFSKDLHGVRVLPKESAHASAAARAFLKWNRCTQRNGIILQTRSDIPFPGLGSSSATIVATIRSLSILFEKKLSDRAVYSIAKKAKTIAEGNAGSYADVACSTYGKLILYENPTRIKRLPAKGPEKISFIAASTPREKTTAEMIFKAGLLSGKACGRLPVIDCMGIITRDACSCIRKGKWGEVGRLMLDYHSMLSFAGVNTPLLSRTVAHAVSLGALGAKTSGAGGGDCAIILARRHNENELLNGMNRDGIRTLGFGLERGGD